MTGKLGSAVLQMLVYYSALSPCIAFTYLLRGIDILTIVLLLGYTFLLSLLLCGVGLLAAAATRARHVQVLLSVLLLMGLAILTVTWCSIVVSAVIEHEVLPFDEEGFWIAQGVILSFYVSYLVLFVLAAAAQLSFASDNRSTKLRVVMLVQQLLFNGWMLYLWLRWPDDDALYVWLSLSAVHWMVMGALLTGEWAQLSPRVKRQLPRSFLGRALLTWFNPGSGTGYVFAVVNLAATTLAVTVTAMFAQIFRSRGMPRSGSLYLFGALLCAYVALYLGLGRLIVLVLRRYLYFGLLLPVLVHVMLVLAGLGLPVFLQAWANGFRGLGEYTALQTPNWAWTLSEASRGRLWSDPLALFLVFGGALAVLVINLAVAAREVEQERQETPQRVVQDELERHPERSLVPPATGSPWDN